MTRVMLDTSAYWVLMRGRAEGELALQRAEKIFLNSIVLGERPAGCIRGKRRGMNAGEEGFSGSSGLY